MKDWNALKERYLSDLLPNRLGGLSANLARIKTLTGKAISQNTIEYLIRESKFFIEWTAMDADIDITVELVELQIQLALWQLRWEKNLGRPSATDGSSCTSTDLVGSNLGAIGAFGLRAFSF